MKHINLKYLIYALLLYIPTLVYMRVEFFLVAIAAVVFFEFPSIKIDFKEFKSNPFDRKHLFSVWLILLIVLVSISNKVLFGHEVICLKDYYASFYLFPLLIMVSKYFGKKEVFQFLLVLTSIEIGFGVIGLMIVFDRIEIINLKKNKKRMVLESLSRVL